MENSSSERGTKKSVKGLYIAGSDTCVCGIGAWETANISHLLRLNHPRFFYFKHTRPVLCLVFDAVASGTRIMCVVTNIYARKIYVCNIFLWRIFDQNWIPCVGFQSYIMFALWPSREIMRIFMKGSKKMFYKSI